MELKAVRVCYDAIVNLAYRCTRYAKREAKDGEVVVYQQVFSVYAIHDSEGIHVDGFLVVWQHDIRAACGTAILYDESDKPECVSIPTFIIKHTYRRISNSAFGS